MLAEISAVAVFSRQLFKPGSKFLLQQILSTSTRAVKMGAGLCGGSKVQVAASTSMAAGPKLRPIVLSGPSGCGKSTIIKKLMENYPGQFGFSVSHTTRNPRPGEVDGKDYHYSNKEEMLKAIENGEFLESAEFSGNVYGTSKKAVQDVLDSGKICIMDIDSQGVKNVKKVNFDCVLVFIQPPSIEELERRLRGRGTESEEAIQKRLNTSKKEFEYAELPDSYHHKVINDDLEKAYIDLRDIISKDIRKLE
ncbi:guanylate kinase-like isoform X1 [Clytia hemisphaerica]|uniref:guanylate kinase-like isoform X1 n=2 Tax=Clytia hemisphaerica TaxID=252671 RepID=UPI0034D657FC